MTRFLFALDDDVELRQVRAMLNRGHEAFKAALDAEHHRHSKVAMGTAYAIDPDTTKEEDERHTKAIEAFRREGDRWKQLLLSFTKMPAT